jgi:DNA-binding transcriptional regulator WhiA
MILVPMFLFKQTRQNLCMYTNMDSCSILLSFFANAKCWSKYKQTLIRFFYIECTFSMVVKILVWVYIRREEDTTNLLKIINVSRTYFIFFIVI